MLGLSGGVSRSLSRHPDALSYDQLYDIQIDPEAQKNLVGKPRKSDVLESMQKTLVDELKRFPNRPFGELIPGGNAVPGRGYDDVFEIVRESAIQLKSSKKNKKRPTPKS